MPIRHENKARYPKDWPALSLAARERAGWRCQHRAVDGERCRCLQYAVGRWTPNERGQVLWVPEHGDGPCDAAGLGLRWPDMHRWTYREAREFAAMTDWANSEEGPKPIVIVLTVAHLNHTPEDCRPENLAAMCQRHHLMYDQMHHRMTAYSTRKRAAATRDLFDAA